MVDVFVSYARADRDLMMPMKARLEALGLSLFVDVDGWLDDTQSFPEALDDGIRTAKAVLGVWTPRSLQRRWVRKECYFALEANKLVAITRAPLTLADVPLTFIDVERKDLTHFDGTNPNEGWARTLLAIRSKLRAWAQQNPQSQVAENVSHKTAQLERAAALELEAIGADARPLKVGTVGLELVTAAWSRIADSLEADHYERFRQVFAQEPAAFTYVVDAAERLSVLARWHAADKNDPAQLTSVLGSVSFPALQKIISAQQLRIAEASWLSDIRPRLRELKMLAETQRYGLEREQLTELGTLFKRAAEVAYRGLVIDLKDEFEFEYGYEQYDFTGSPMDYFRTLVEVNPAPASGGTISLFLQRGWKAKIYRGLVTYDGDRTLLAERTGAAIT